MLSLTWVHQEGGGKAWREAHQHVRNRVAWLLAPVSFFLSLYMYFIIVVPVYRQRSRQDKFNCRQTFTVSSRRSFRTFTFVSIWRISEETRSSILAWVVSQTDTGQLALRAIFSRSISSIARQGTFWQGKCVSLVITMQITHTHTHTHIHTHSLFTHMISWKQHLKMWVQASFILCNISQVWLFRRVDTFPAAVQTLFIYVDYSPCYLGCKNVCVGVVGTQLKQLQMCS